MKGSRMQTRRERDEGHVFAGASPAVCAEKYRVAPVCESQTQGSAREGLM